MTVDRELHLARLLREDGPSAPPALRARIEADIARADERRLAPRLGNPRLALAGVVAAALVALLVTLLPSPSGTPTVSDAHALFALPSTGPAPAPEPGRPGLLAKRFEGLHFPNWSPEFGWKAAGQRSDELGDRRGATVFYTHEGHKIAYTIVSGSPLEPPTRANARRIDGVDYYAFRHGGHDVVMFERGGKTCVLSGHVIHASTVLKLARWRPEAA